MQAWIIIVFIFLQTSPGHVEAVVGTGYAPTAADCETEAAKAISDAKQNPQFVGSKYSCNVVDVPPIPTVS